MRTITTIIENEQPQFGEAKVFHNILNTNNTEGTYLVGGHEREVLKAEQFATQHSSHVPQDVSSLRFWLSLEELELYDSITMFLETAPKNIQIAAKAATVFERDSVLIQQVQELLEMSNEQVDEVFRKAILLEL
jgi:hypothetical protein